MLDHCIQPDWPAPANVKAMSSTRQFQGGHSQGDFAQFNLGRNSGESQHIVEANRGALKTLLPSPPFWLQQVHGDQVIDAQNYIDNIQADGCIATGEHQVCAVLTADCLPVLLCDQAGGCVAAVHAGWQGLDAGIVAAAIKRLPVEPDSLLAWLGPAISQQHYQVGDDFRERFVKKDAGYDQAFIQINGRWHADLYALARRQLNLAGVTAVYGGDYCTFADKQRFYSYRRDGKQTGRQASLIWIEEV